MNILEESIEDINFKNLRIDGDDFVFDLECTVNNGMDKYKYIFYGLLLCSIGAKINIEKESGSWYPEYFRAGNENCTKLCIRSQEFKFKDPSSNRLYDIERV